MKPYVVEITERYRKHVVVYAEDEGQAEEFAWQLCDCGDIDMERNCYAGRVMSTCRANADDLETYDVYRA